MKLLAKQYSRLNNFGKLGGEGVKLNVLIVQEWFTLMDACFVLFHPIGSKVNQHPFCFSGKDLLLNFSQYGLLSAINGNSVDWGLKPCHFCCTYHDGLKFKALILYCINMNVVDNHYCYFLLWLLQAILLRKVIRERN